MNRRMSGAITRGGIAQIAQTVTALARRTSSTQATAEAINSFHEMVCSNGKRHANQATAPAASSPPTGGSNFGSEAVPARSKAFML